MPASLTPPPLSSPPLRRRQFSHRPQLWCTQHLAQQLWRASASSSMYPVAWLLFLILPASLIPFSILTSHTAVIGQAYEFSFHVTVGSLPACGQVSILTLAVSGDSILITLTAISRSIYIVIYLTRFSHRSAYDSNNNNNYYCYYLLLLSGSAGLC